MATTVTAAITLLLPAGRCAWPCHRQNGGPIHLCPQPGLGGFGGRRLFRGLGGIPGRRHRGHAPGAGCGRLCGPLGKKPAPGGGALPHGPFAAAITTVRGKVLSIFPAPASHQPRGLILAAFCGIMHHGML